MAELVHLEEDDVPWKMGLTTTLAAVAGAIAAGTTVVEAVNRLVDVLGVLRREIERLIDSAPEDEEERPPDR